MRTSSALPSIIQSITFTTQDVFQELLQLNPNKACGPDLLTPLLLKRNAGFICESLCNRFNQSMAMGSLPKDWTSANVIPLYKREDFRIASNYRPISLTSIIVKIIEKIICKQIPTALEQSNHVSDAQFGFHAKHSTMSLLLSVVHD